MESMNVIQCPHCSELIDYNDYIEVGDMDGDFTMDCESCGGNFEVSFETNILFTTSI